MIDRKILVNIDLLPDNRFAPVACYCTRFESQDIGPAY